MAEVKHLDSKNFESETKDKVALVDFWAEWCGPCKMMLPVLEQVANEVGDKALVGKVNVDDSQDLAIKFNIRSIPAIFLFKNGEIVWQAVGVQSKKALVDSIEKALK